MLRMLTGGSPTHRRASIQEWAADELLSYSLADMLVMNDRLHAELARWESAVQSCMLAKSLPTVSLVWEMCLSGAHPAVCLATSAVSHPFYTVRTTTLAASILLDVWMVRPCPCQKVTPGSRQGLCRMISGSPPWRVCFLAYNCTFHCHRMRQAEVTAGSQSRPRTCRCRSTAVRRRSPRWGRSRPWP